MCLAHRPGAVQGGIGEACLGCRRGGVWECAWPVGREPAGGVGETGWACRPGAGRRHRMGAPGERGPSRRSGGNGGR